MNEMKNTDIWNDGFRFPKMTCFHSPFFVVLFFFFTLMGYHHQVAIRAVPRRNDFYMRIAQGGSIEKLGIELGKWLCGLECIVKHVSGFLERGGYGKV